MGCYSFHVLSLPPKPFVPEGDSKVYLSKVTCKETELKNYLLAKKHLTRHPYKCVYIFHVEIPKPN